MRSIILLILLFVQSLDGLAQVYTVQTVPNTKVSTNKLVTNPDGILSSSVEEELNTMLDSLEKKTTSQVAVVMLNSIGEEDEFDFAQELFTTWKIGQASNDNGLLILFVSDRHVIRFHTGYGLEGILPDAICKRIQMQYMVPMFKEGKINEGMLAGVEEVVKVIADHKYRNEVVSPTEKEFKPEDWIGVAIILGIAWFITALIIYFIMRGAGSFPDSKQFTKHDEPHSKLSSIQWFFWFVVVPPALMVVLSISKRGDVFWWGFYFYLIAQVVFKFVRIQKELAKLGKERKFHDQLEFLKNNKGYWIFLAIIFPVPVIFLTVLYFGKMRGIRTRPRTCLKCSGKMKRLDEKADDEYLTKSMITEENIKSVDYDVWLCESCSEIEIEAYYNDRTQFTQCPKCASIAFYETGRKTIRHATESNSGEVRVTCTCKNCRHQKSSTETIPRVVPSSSSSDSSSSWSSSSSSSDSGGSFGGGDSGGGGASSSW